MTGHPLGSDALRRGLVVARLATALSIVALVGVAPVVTGTPHPARAARPLGVERIVPAERPAARTGLATLAVNRPPAPVGDLGRAIDTDAVVALAGPVATPLDAPPGGWFLVGDSTFTAAAQHLGGGSAFPGVGFELAPFVGTPNPLRSPPHDFDGVVVIGVSIWDGPVTDATAYVAAVDHYRAAGHPVLVVEVPEQFGPGDEVVTTTAEAEEYRTLNRLVADALGCALAPWTVRDVETSGDVDGGDDHVHPTAAGVIQLIENLTEVADDICRPDPPGELA